MLTGIAVLTSGALPDAWVSVLSSTDYGLPRQRMSVQKCSLCQRRFQISFEELVMLEARHRAVGSCPLHYLLRF